MERQIFRKAERPEPIEELNRSNGVIKWGKDNLYPQFAIGLVYDNPVHGGIIEQKVKFIMAGGVDTKHPDKSILDAKIDGYSWGEIIEELCLDNEIIDEYVLIWKRVGNKWYPKTVGFELIRSLENGKFAYSEDWGSGMQGEDTNYKEYTSITSIDKDVDNECIQVQMRRPKQRVIKGKGRATLSKSYYPVAPYSGAIVDILAGIEMSFFTYSEVVNGWKGGTWISLNNGFDNDEERRRKTEQAIKDQASDEETQGGMVITYANGKDSAPTITQVSGNDLDKRYREAKATVRDAIMVAHGVISPTLFGVFTSTMFGSKDEMEMAYELFKANYIDVRRRNIIAPINWAYELLNGINPQFFFNEPPALFKSKNEPAKFKKVASESEVLDLFNSCGRSIYGVRVLSSRPVNLDNFGEEDFRKSFLTSEFSSLSEIEKNIISLLNDGLSYGEITKALKISKRDLSDALFRLSDRGYIDNFVPTDKAIRAVIDEHTIEVVYSYDVRNDVPEAKKSRDFCVYMMTQNKVYTMIEIDTISMAVDFDVWQYRGGNYTNPLTGKTTPFCRHEWKQHIIYSKKK